MKFCRNVIFIAIRNFGNFYNNEYEYVKIVYKKNVY